VDALGLQTVEMSKRLHSITRVRVPPRQRCCDQLDLPSIASASGLSPAPYFFQRLTAVL
jgi:hypothetical protein